MCCFLFLLSLSLAGSAFGAFSVDPAVINIRVDRNENSAWIDVVHTGGGPIAVELIVYERELDLEGEVKMDSLIRTSDFMVYPSQIILQPKERARVQVVYKGKKVTADKAYLLFSKEVPLELASEGEGVRMGLITLMNYYSVISLNVGKPGKLTFVSSKALGDGMIEVIVENKSPGRVPFDRVAIVIGKDRITDFTGMKNSIMPGQQRRFTFKYNRPVKAGEVKFE